MHSLEVQLISLALQTVIRIKGGRTKKCSYMLMRTRRHTQTRIGRFIILALGQLDVWVHSVKRKSFFPFTNASHSITKKKKKKKQHCALRRETKDTQRNSNGRSPSHFVVSQEGNSVIFYRIWLFEARETTPLTELHSNGNSDNRQGNLNCLEYSQRRVAKGWTLSDEWLQPSGTETDLLRNCP